MDGIEINYLRDYNEKTILGSMLYGDEEIIADCLATLTEDDFSCSTWKKIFSAIKRTAADGAVDLVTVSNHLPFDDNLQNTLVTLMNDAPAPSNYKEYIRCLRNERRRDEMRIGLGKLIKKANDGADITEDVQTLVDSVKLLNTKRYEAVGSIVGNVLFDMQEGTRNFTPTGFPDIDQVIGGGLTEGKLLVIGGRPSMGKSTLAMNIAANVARKGNPVLFFTIEDTKDELVRRMICYVSGLSMKAAMDRTNAKKTAAAAEEIATFKMIIEDGSKTISDICSIAWDVKKQYKKLPLIVVDYIGLVKIDAKKNIQRYLEIGEITRSLKQLALDLETTVIACCQLNRSSENGEEIRKPRPSDLRESGSIEQDADIILFPYRESLKENEGSAEIIVAKNRNGRVCTTKAYWCGEQFKFAQLAKDRN